MKKKLNNLIVITGPTASGKSDFAMKVAENLIANDHNAELISADSRQVFKYMDIGTAKPTPIEQKQITHHFIDIKTPDQYYSSGIFGNEANQLVNNLFEHGKIPIIVGGSGLYVKSLCEGFFEEEKDQKLFEMREKLNRRFQNEGIDELYEELKQADIQSYNLYCDKNPRRVIRALEYYHWKGSKLSESNKTNKPPNRNFNPIYFGIEHEREVLYQRINSRVLAMIEQGLVKEVKNIIDMGYDENLNSLNTVGYKEIIAHLKGIYSLDTAISEIQKNTRRFAKRQITWFKKIESMEWIKPSELEFTIENIVKNLKTN